MKVNDLVRFTLSAEEKDLLEKNVLKAKKIAIKHNVRLTKSKIVKKVFLDLLQDEDFINKIIKQVWDRRQTFPRPGKELTLFTLRIIPAITYNKLKITPFLTKLQPKPDLLTIYSLENIYFRLATLLC